MVLNFVYWLEEVRLFHFLSSLKDINHYLGTLFILAIAAAANSRSTIRNYLTHDIILRINYLLRCPNPGECQLSNQVTLIDEISRPCSWKTSYSRYNSSNRFIEAEISGNFLFDVQPRPSL